MTGRQLPRWFRTGDLVNTPQGHGHIVNFSRVPPERGWTVNVQLGDRLEQFPAAAVECVMRDRGPS